MLKGTPVTVQPTAGWTVFCHCTLGYELRALLAVYVLARLSSARRSQRRYVQRPSANGYYSPSRQIFRPIPPMSWFLPCRLVARLCAYFSFVRAALPNGSSLVRSSRWYQYGPGSVLARVVRPYLRRNFRSVANVRIRVCRVLNSTCMWASKDSRIVVAYRSSDYVSMFRSGRGTWRRIVGSPCLLVVGTGLFCVQIRDRRYNALANTQTGFATALSVKQRACQKPAQVQLADTFEALEPSYGG